MKTLKLSALVAALTVAVVGLIGFTPVLAGASDAAITGSASCASNGTYSVTWTVTTSGVPAGQSATVSQVGVSPYTPVSGLPATVSGDASVTFVQSNIPASDSQASEDVLVTWGDTSVSPPTGYATLAGTCNPPPPPTPTPTPTTAPTTPTTTTQQQATQPTSGAAVAQPTTAAATTPTTNPTPQIAFTGANTETTAGIGTGLLALGGGLVLAARRRRVGQVAGED
jgi:hypothetical protein